MQAQLAMGDSEFWPEIVTATAMEGAIKWLMAPKSAVNRMFKGKSTNSTAYNKARREKWRF